MINSKGIAIFSDPCHFNLETQVNDWLTDFQDELQPVDFRLSTCPNGAASVYTIVVIYENIDDHEDEAW